MIYVVLTHAGRSFSSVQNKVKRHVNVLNELGEEAKGLFFTFNKADEGIEDQIQYIYVEKPKESWFMSHRMKMAMQKAIYDYFEDVSIQEKDVIFCRYTGTGPWLKKLTHHHPRQVVFQHLSFVPDEIKLEAKAHKIKWNLSSLLSHIEFVTLPLWMEKKYSVSTKQLARFGVSNSGQIADLEDISPKRKNYVKLVLGDSVDTRKLPALSRPKLQEEFRMILLKGASAQAHYYGIDRLMKGIKEYSGDLKIALHLYGKNLDYEKVMVEELKIQQSVCFHGFVLPEQLPEIISDIHLGISLLAVHRKGLSSTTTIKSREYCSRGLPFIYAHHDPDFSDREECGLFALRLPATDEPLDFQSIIKWYKVSESLEGLTETMHEYAIQYLDDRVKMKKLLDCIYQQND